MTKEYFICAYINKQGNSYKLMRLNEGNLITSRIALYVNGQFVKYFESEKAAMKAGDQA